MNRRPRGRRLSSAQRERLIAQARIELPALDAKLAKHLGALRELARR